MPNIQIKLLKMEDIQNITGWSPNTIKKVMNDPDFPVLKIGKENQVMEDAFSEYLMHRRELRGD